MTDIDLTRLEDTVAALRWGLLSLCGPAGHWTGHLSSSALSTATAAFALAQVDREQHRFLIDRGLLWLCRNQSADGGWGDTIQSPGNLSTTMLCYSALTIPDGPSACRESVARAESWLHRTVGTLAPQSLAGAVTHQYGDDRTFSAPILTMCALAGRLGVGPQAWGLVKPLPFELAVLPRGLFRWLRLPVVSYALPALIAIGQARHAHLKPRCPVTRLLRNLARNRSLDVLSTLQPDNGGFLEAAPLTSFVVMSLAASGQCDHPVVSKSVEFLVGSIRDDGSWPIDTNLATWVTTLSISALLTNDPEGGLSASERDRLAQWLLDCQCKRVHPYTQAAPGGWAWSDLPGAVPDGDDTAGALVALYRLGIRSDAVSNSAAGGVKWLLGIRNADGGIPTFCRGWTKLPFDRSSPDVTAHAVGAMSLWLGELPSPLKARTDDAIRGAMRFLRDEQRADGSWVPLWFGNQSAPGQENPVYGTGRVLSGLSLAPESYMGLIEPARQRAVQWLLAAQNTDGGWGGATGVVSSIEETALAVDALAGACRGGDNHDLHLSIHRGVDWLISKTDEGRSVPASPIGLYFARLWYFEELYPQIFTLAALGKARRLMSPK
jgi:squalene-hopene/tetraprenyl-beta-curcumene cyclase